MNPTDTWIGLIEVEPQPGNDSLDDAVGAFVNVVALASSEQEFVDLVRSTMNEHGFRILAMRDVVSLSTWSERNTIEPRLAGLVRGLTPEYRIQFDEFQSYMHRTDA